jgi:PIN domain nuclease of toxin-antitoxin system
VDIEIAVAATELPDIHGDPCRRMIIVSAKLLALPVVTADPVFKEYGIETVA